MPPEMGLDLFHVQADILRRSQIPAQDFLQLYAAGDPVQVLLPFVKEDTVKIPGIFEYTDFGHDIWIQEIIFKGIIFQHQYVLPGDSGQPVRVLQIPVLIIPAEGGGELFPVFAVPVPDHQKTFPKVRLIDIFEIGVGFDVGTAIGGNDGDPGELSLLVIDLRIIFLEQKGKPAFVLLAFHNKNKAYVHQISCVEAQVVQNGGEIGVFPDGGPPVLPQNHLADLPAVKLEQQIGGMSAEDHLAFLGDPVKDLAGFFLQAGVEEDLRILHEDQSGDPSLVLHIGFQKGQKINAAHPFGQPGDRGGTGVLLGLYGGPYLKDAVCIAGEFIADVSFHAAVPVEVFIYFMGKGA